VTDGSEIKRFWSGNEIREGFLRFFEGKEFNEIAFILDMTESGAKMRTYRALDRLRTKFNLKIKYDGKE